MKFVSYGTFQNDRRMHGIEYAAKRSARLGFDSVEFFERCLSTTPPIQSFDARYTKRVLDENGLSVACYSLLMDLSAKDFIEVKDTFARHLEFAARLETPYLHHTVVPSLLLEMDAPPYEMVLERVFEHVVWIANRCAEYGVTCLYEPQGLYFNGVEGLQLLFQRVGKICKNVGICGDVGNSLFVDVSANRIYDAFIHEIRHVHVKDYMLSTHSIEDQGKSVPLRGGKWITECPIGNGVIDFSYCFGRLKQVGYDDAISFEISGDDKTVSDAMTYIKSIWEES